MRQRLLLSLLAALLAVGLTTTAGAKKGSSRAGDGSRPATYTFPADNAAVFPEGIAREPGTKRFFVGSTDDGTIFRGDLREPQLTPLPRYADDPDVPDDSGDAERRTAIGMKADKRGNLVVAGGDTGKVFVLSTADGSTRGTPLDTMPTGPSFLNDVAISKGYAYVTDSQQPFLYRVRLGEDGPVGAIEKFAAFTPVPPAGTPDRDGQFVYAAGFNANGIAIDAGGKYAFIVQSNTGEIFRVDLRTKAVREVDLGGKTLPNGDGLLLKGNVLYVVQNRQELIVPIRLVAKGTRGVVGTGVTGPQLKYPTTIALDGKRLLAVNSQFGARMAMQPPELPFDVATIRAPKAPKGGR